MAGVCAFLLLSGCSASQKTAGDPLFGEFGPKGVGPAPAPAASPTRTRAETSASPTSSSLAPPQAALAAGLLPLDDSRPLVIGRPDTTAAPSGPATLASTPKANQGATLSAPEPIVQPVPRQENDPVLPATTWNAPPVAAASRTSTPVASAVVTPAATPGPAVQPQAAPAKPAPSQSTASQPNSYQSILKELARRGVTKQKAENVAGGVQFTCVIPNPARPNIERTYRTIGPDYYAAARAALWKIDNDSNR